MLLPIDEVRRGLLHFDREVCETVIDFFALNEIRDAGVMSLVIQRIDDSNWHEAFSSYDFLPGLLQSKESLDWLIGRLPSLLHSQHGMRGHIAAAIRNTIINADTLLLSQRLRELLSAVALGEGGRPAIIARIEAASLPPGDLFGRLESICQELGPDSVWPSDQIQLSNRLIEGLRRYPDACKQQVTQILSQRAEDYWPLELGVRLAGELRLRDTVPLLINLLIEEEWLWEDCAQALGRIGSDDGLDQHGHRILFRGKTEDQAFEDFGGEAGAVAFTVNVVFDGGVLRQDGHYQPA